MATTNEYTLGTHNLHDEAGVPTFFADIIIFTEAIAPTIIAKVKQKWAHVKGRLLGYRIVVCKQQRDLVVAVRRKHFKVVGKGYQQVVKGWAGVTPNRGTFVLYLKDRETEKAITVVAEHRINAAFAPWIRGEKVFRMKAWRTHTDHTIRVINRLKNSGFLVVAGGDLNIPDGVSGYEGALHERGDHFDRLGASGRIGLAQYLSKQGSDHPRLRTTVYL